MLQTVGGPITIPFNSNSCSSREEYRLYKKKFKKTSVIKIKMDDEEESIAMERLIENLCSVKSIYYFGPLLRRDRRHPPSRSREW